MVIRQLRLSHKLKRYPKRSLLSLFLLVSALAIYLAVIWFYIIQSYKVPNLQSGQLSSVQTYGGEDYDSSLDLRIAQKAKYPSSALQQISDLGSSNGIDEQTVRFAVTADNLEEYALYMHPTAAPPPTGYPTLILCHGYFNPEQYQTTNGYLGDMQFYASHGFAVIKPDYRGQGLSLKAGSPDGAFYSMAYNTDVLSLISAIKKTPYLNKNDINMWGHSMGAYIALRASVISPDIKNLILLSAPVGTSQDLFSDYMAVSDRDNPIALKLRQSLLIRYGTPVTDPFFWNNASPLSYLKNLHANVEINVGTADKIVPPVFSADLDSALTKVGKPHEYFIYQGGDHGLGQQRDLIWQRSLNLLQTDKVSQS